MSNRRKLQPSQQDNMTPADFEGGEIPAELASYFGLPNSAVIAAQAATERTEQDEELPRPRKGHFVRMGQDPVEVQPDEAVDIAVENEETAQAEPDGLDIRGNILADAWNAVSQDRNTEYGPPEDTFSTIAALWSDYLDMDVNPHDVCNMMILLKVARTRYNPTHRDSWVDIAGYAACGGEVAAMYVEVIE